MLRYFRKSRRGPRNSIVALNRCAVAYDAGLRLSELLNLRLVSRFGLRKVAPELLEAGLKLIRFLFVAGFLLCKNLEVKILDLHRSFWDGRI